MLSSRIIDNGALCTTWICHDSLNPTDGFPSPPSSIWARLRFQEFMDSVANADVKSTRKRSDETPEAFFSSVWTVFVQQYCKGRLSYDHDKLPAIAGLAERVSAQFGGEYLAGLWRNELWYGLIWHNSKGPRHKRLPEYFAPSWSWASIPDGDIGFISTDSCVQDDGFKVVNSHVELVDPLNRFGSVSSGFLTIQGRVLTARYDTMVGPNTHARGGISIDLPVNYEMQSEHAVLQDVALAEGSNSLQLWFVCLCWDKKRKKMWGIILKQLNDEKFARFGLFSIQMRQTGLDWREELRERWQDLLELKQFTIL